MKELVLNIVNDAVKKSGYSVPRTFSVSPPPKAEAGDYATNVALILASTAKENPHLVAEKIVSSLLKHAEIAKAEIAGPGFINILLSDKCYRDAFLQIVEAGRDYGRGNAKRTKVQVEYVSANPTGPLHVGNARGGPIGELIANVLQFLGYEVSREFYVNDSGGQVKRFARSLYYWYAKKADPKVEFPEGGYPGKYIEEISLEIQKEQKDKIVENMDESELVQLFEKEGLCKVIKTIRDDCELLGIKFDNWAYQSDLQYSGKSEETIKKLQELGATADKEGAVWFKSPLDPDLQDRECVLRKSDEGGMPTYFADDIAYHLEKYERGFSRVIDIWGANHHGHVPRLKAAMKVFGISEDKLDMVLYQYIRLIKAGKAVSMGKRLGNFVTLRQVIEAGVAPDVFKYFILAQNLNTPFDFDLDLAADTSERNPVYYIKYAHARICSILNKAGFKLKDEEIILPKGDSELQFDFALLKDEKEHALVKELVNFPEILQEITVDFQIQTLPHFAYKIASLFHDFYSSCQVISEDKKMTESRLALVIATKYVIANCLSLCGIEAPEHM